MAISFEEAEKIEMTNRVFDKITKNGRDQVWLTRWTEQNAMDIQTLIDEEIFGNFQEKHPDATQLDKLCILQAFMVGESLEGFDVAAITRLLERWCNPIARERNLDKALLWAMLRGEEAWKTGVFLSASVWLKRLCYLQILDYMVKTLAAHDFPQEEKNALKAWVLDQRLALLRPVPEPSLEMKITRFLGWRHATQFLRIEMTFIAKLFDLVKKTVLQIGTGDLFQATGHVLMDTFLLSFWVMFFALLPFRLLVMGMNEATYLLERCISRGMDVLWPNHRFGLGGVSTFSKLCFFALSVGVRFYFGGAPFSIIRDVQDFLLSKCFQNIGFLAMGFGGLEILSGTACFVARKVHKWWKGGALARHAQMPESVFEPENILQDALEVNQQKVQNVPLNLEKREHLKKMLLCYQRVLKYSPIDENGEDGEVRESERQEIVRELEKLRCQEDYSLTKLDRILIFKRGIDGAQFFQEGENDVQDDSARMVCGV